MRKSQNHFLASNEFWLIKKEGLKTQRVLKKKD